MFMINEYRIKETDQKTLNEMKIGG